MKDKLIRIEPVDRIKPNNKDYPQKQNKHSQGHTKEKDKKNSLQNLEQTNNQENEKINIQKNNSQEKNRNVTTEDIRKHMEANSPSSLYRLMNIMNTDAEGAIKYLAELSKKNAKSTKPRKQKDDEYSR